MKIQCFIIPLIAGSLLMTSCSGLSVLAGRGSGYGVTVGVSGSGVSGGGGSYEGSLFDVNQANWEAQRDNENLQNLLSGIQQANQISLQAVADSVAAIPPPPAINP